MQEIGVRRLKDSFRCRAEGNWNWIVICALEVAELKQKVSERRNKFRAWVKFRVIRVGVSFEWVSATFGEFFYYIFRHNLKHKEQQKFFEETRLKIDAGKKLITGEKIQKKNSMQQVKLKREK